MDKKYWDEIYLNKAENEVSWFQELPTKSLELISELGLKAEDSIIDIGGGDSHLVDHLLSKGFKNISVLDISIAALNRAKERLGEKANLVKFIVSDVINFKSSEQYKLWHDRATFHFLITAEDVDAYLNIANQSIAPNGYLILSTFSKTGPDKCSGLPISKYSDTDLKILFEKYFTNIRCFEDTHQTPWGTQQNFTYCGFKKR